MFPAFLQPWIQSLLTLAQISQFHHSLPYYSQPTPLNIHLKTLKFSSSQEVSRITYVQPSSNPGHQVLEQGPNQELQLQKATSRKFFPTYATPLRSVLARH